MPNTITVSIRDENVSGKILQEHLVEFKSHTVTVKDIIEVRVRQEVYQYNQSLPEIFYGLIQPTDAEKIINGFKPRSKNPIDAEKQVYVALDAFQKNGFFILIDNVQSVSLDQQVELNNNTTISFLKLTPLVGG